MRHLQYILAVCTVFLVGCINTVPNEYLVPSCTFLSDNVHYVYVLQTGVFVRAYYGYYDYTYDVHYVDGATGADKIVYSAGQNPLSLQKGDSSFLIIPSQGPVVQIKNDLSDTQEVSVIQGNFRYLCDRRKLVRNLDGKVAICDSIGTVLNLLDTGYLLDVNKNRILISISKNYPALLAIYDTNGVQTALLPRPFAYGVGDFYGDNTIIGVSFDSLFSIDLATMEVKFRLKLASIPAAISASAPIKMIIYYTLPNQQLNIIRLDF